MSEAPQPRQVLRGWGWGAATTTAAGTLTRRSTPALSSLGRGSEAQRRQPALGCPGVADRSLGNHFQFSFSHIFCLLLPSAAEKWALSARRLAGYFLPIHYPLSKVNPTGIPFSKGTGSSDKGLAYKWPKLSCAHNAESFCPSDRAFSFQLHFVAAFPQPTTRPRLPWARQRVEREMRRRRAMVSMAVPGWEMQGEDQPWLCVHCRSISWDPPAGLCRSPTP